MFTNIYKSMFISALAVIALLASSTDMWSQNFTNNTGGTYSVGTTGTIRMKDQTGKFDGAIALGRDNTHYIPGKVVWGTGCSITSFVVDPNPTTGGPMYYTDLELANAGAVKYAGDVHLIGDYTIAAGTGARDYNGKTFYFEGTTGVQDIAGENAGNSYNNVDLSGAADKHVLTTTIAQINGTLVQAAASKLINDGTLLLDGTVTANGPVENNGTLTMGTTNDGTFAGLVTNKGIFNGGGAGTNTLAFTGTFDNNPGVLPGGGFYANGAPVQFKDVTQQTGTFDVNSGETVKVNGSFAVTGGSVTLACTSNFEYDGAAAQTITKTTGGFFPTGYGNLTLNAGGLMTGDGDISVCNILTVNNEVEMSPGANNYTMIMQNGTPGTSQIAYSATTNPEIRGTVKWTNIPGGAFEYVYNNTATRIVFGAATTDFTLKVLPATNPAQIITDQTKNITRQITGSFATAGGNIKSLQVGWESTDELGGFDLGRINKMRFAEGYDVTKKPQTIAIAGASYGSRPNVGASPFRSITYAGGTGALSLASSTKPGTTSEFVSGDEIVLTTAPMEIVSIVNGRWSNPTTWDVGVVPTYEDDVEVKTIVWTGDDTPGGLFGGSGFSGDEIDGHVAGTAGAAANSIKIGNPAPTFTESALVLGNNDASMAATAGGVGYNNEYVFRTVVDLPTNMIDNANTTPLGGSANGDANAAGTGLNGIWVRAVGSGFIPVLGTTQLTNANNVTNKSIIEIGKCN